MSYLRILFITVFIYLMEMDPEKYDPPIQKPLVALGSFALWSTSSAVLGGTVYSFAEAESTSGLGITMGATAAGVFLGLSIKSWESFHQAMDKRSSENLN